ncbi:MAG: Aspartate carbamoyltransferase [Firmicutes bacterium]|nr:Aspartate carbamoyltransferase [Bacillota bacterium]
MKIKNLLGIRELESEDIIQILDTAALMKPIMETKNKKTNYLQGKILVTLFYEPSTRTRVSFELAAKYLGATTTNISTSTSSVVKGETLIDTARTLQAMGVDIVVMRHPMTASHRLLERHLDATIINAGDGINEHPTQALLDIFTMRQYKQRIKGLKVVIAGDILHSRVARSNIWGLTKLGAKVAVAGPSTLIPRDIEKLGVEVYNNVRDAAVDADVVMALRVQLERQKSGLFPSLREYSMYFGIDESVLEVAKDDVLVMHPGPVNRGVELPSSIMDASNSAIEEQVTNGVAVRMALLYLLTRGGDI